ncbi:MAG TPA: phage recombination protein Bet [Thermodesulfobacteriota bacterium]|nr:phage recombination protein Bet [Thermodesulfobacteriota bacterium]HNU71843.1 phage recombination protein Bet [Thermodesulfobacteriota bacterium]
MAEQALARQGGKEITYKAVDGQAITLTVDIVKKFLVRGRPECVTLQEFTFFMALCQSRKMNPYIGDCYLIKYTENDPAAVVTSIEYFRKRARAQPDCQGWTKGIIVRNETGTTSDTYGLYMPEHGEVLVGGWFEAQPRGWTTKCRLEVNLKAYIKKTKEGRPTKFWSEENQPTMIAKVAESQGLRHLWPDEFSKLYTAEEISPESIPAPNDNLNHFNNSAASFFDALVTEQQPTAFQTQMLSRYLELAAQKHNLSIADTKQRAAEDFASFWSGFARWCVTTADQSAKIIEGGAQES